MFPKSYILRNFFKQLALFTVFSGSRAATVPLPTAQDEAASHHSAAATCRSRPSQASADITVGRLSCGGQTAPRPWEGTGGRCLSRLAILRNILTSSCAILCCFAPTVLLPANMRKMGTERSRRAQHKQDKQTTLCPETNLLRSVANVPGWAVNFLQLPRSIATAALEHFSRGSVRLLQSPRRKLTAPSVKTASYVKP